MKKKDRPAMIFLLLCLLTLPFYCPAKTSSPPRLVFKKQIKLPQKNNVYTYKIKKGEYLYSIMRAHGVRKGQFAQAIKKIKKLNPDLKNLDKLDPGQKIVLPKTLRQEKPKQPANQETNAQRTVEYTVKPGDYLGAIILKKAHVPDKETFKKLLTLTKKLNPHISDLNHLKVGQTLTLALPSLEKKKPPAPKSKDKKQDQAETNQAPISPEEANKYLVLDILKTFGFSPAPGHNLLFPSENKGWLEIELHKTPIFKTPWAEKIILIPEENPKKDFLEKIKQHGLQVCLVDATWSPKLVFADLENALDRRLISWEQFEPLILNFQGQTLEISSKFFFMLKHKGKKSFFMFNHDLKRKISNIMAGYLKSLGIECFSLIKKNKGSFKIKKIEPVNSENIFVPAVSKKELLNMLKLDAQGPFQDLEKSTQTSGEKLLKKLKEFGVLEEKALSLKSSFGRSSKSFLRLHLSLACNKRQGQEAIFLPSGRSSAFLVSLLSLKGYSCYVIK